MMLISPVETVCVATDTLPPVVGVVVEAADVNASVMSVRIDSSLQQQLYSIVAHTTDFTSTHCSIRSVLSREESAKIRLTTSIESVSEGLPEVVVEGPPPPPNDWCGMDVGGV